MSITYKGLADNKYWSMEEAWCFKVRFETSITDHEEIMETIPSYFRAELYSDNVAIVSVPKSDVLELNDNDEFETCTEPEIDNIYNSWAAENECETITSKTKTKTKIEYPTKNQLESMIMKESPEAMKWLSEFADWSYDILKKIYESDIDQKVTQDAGCILNERGGLDAMVANYYIFMYIWKYMNPVKTPHDYKTLLRYREISYYWHRVGQWKA